MTSCNGLAAVAHHLHFDDVYSAELMVFKACKLIPLYKKPDVIRVCMFLGRKMKKLFVI